jgi:hypothetical protein
MLKSKYNPNSMFEEKIEESNQETLQKEEIKIIDQYNFNLCRFEKGEWNNRIIKADLIVKMPPEERAESVAEIKEKIHKKVESSLAEKANEDTYHSLSKDLELIDQFSTKVPELENQLSDFIIWEKETIANLERLLQTRPEIKEIIADYGLWADNAEALLNYSPDRSLSYFNKILKSLNPNFSEAKIDAFEVFDPEKIIEYTEKIKAWGKKLLDILENNQIEKAKKFFSGSESEEREEHRFLASGLYGNDYFNKHDLVSEEAIREIAKRGSLDNLKAFLEKRRTQIISKRDLVCELADLNLELQLISQESTEFETEAGRHIANASELERYIKKGEEKIKDALAAKIAVKQIIQEDNRIAEPIDYNHGYIEFKNINTALDEMDLKIRELENKMREIKDRIEIAKTKGQTTNIFNRLRKKSKHESGGETHGLYSDLEENQAEYKGQNDKKVELERQLFFDKEKINSSLRTVDLSEFEKQITIAPHDLGDYLEALLEVLEKESRKQIPARVKELAQLDKEYSQRLSELKQKL